MSENNQGRRGRPANEALGQTIVDAACELFVELGFQATTMDKVAQRAKISKLSIYRHFENKEALFSAAIAATASSLHHRPFLKASTVRPKISSWRWDQPCFAPC
jgi:AcrR family transcriptional regulator